MKILVLNYRYFLSGGPERYMFGVKKILEERGHQVVPFAINYAKNCETPYARYFAAPPVRSDVVLYKDAELSTTQKLKLLAKATYNFEAKRKVKQLIREEKPDVAYALQIVNLLYPSVIDACYEMGVPVVYRLSDFQLLCPNYKFFRDGRICEECIHGQYYRGFLHKCLKDSFAVSGARVFAMYLHRARRMRRKVAAYVTPSKILREKMLEGGFDPAKVFHIPTFIDLPAIRPDLTPGEYILYVGQIVPFKGVRTLVEAFGLLRRDRPIRLLLAGSSMLDEEEKLRAMVSSKGISGIEFVGFKSGDALAGLYRSARFVVMPTLWYENIPNVVLEAMSYGKPVVGSDLGGIAEIIEDGRDGLLFEAGNAEALKSKMERLMDDDSLVTELGTAARKTMEDEFSVEGHYTRLSGVLEGACDARAAHP